MLKVKAEPKVIFIFLWVIIIIIIIIMCLVSAEYVWKPTVRRVRLRSGRAMENQETSWSWRAVTRHASSAWHHDADYEGKKVQYLSTSPFLIIVELRSRSRSRSGPGQVQVRKVRNWPEPYHIFGLHPPTTTHHTNFFLALEGSRHVRFSVLRIED